MIMQKILIPLAFCATPLTAQDSTEVALAKSVLDQLQQPSFEANREYCGYWYVDGEDQIASQLCSVGCLTQDPNFVAGLDGELQISYTIDELRALEAE